MAVGAADGGMHAGSLYRECDVGPEEERQYTIVAKRG